MTHAGGVAAPNRDEGAGGASTNANRGTTSEDLPLVHEDALIDIVRDGYDRIAERYAAWAAAIRDDARERTTARLLALLPPTAAVLDLGCGNGLPTTRLLADRGHRVTAIDVSAAQVARCRANVPEATVMQAEMTAAAFAAGSFDAAVSFYAITHVPRARHAALFRQIAGWLRPDGIFAACLGAGAADGVDADWLGVPMAFSHFAADANLALLRAAGFAIPHVEVAETIEDGAAASFLWVVATAPSA